MTDTRQRAIRISAAHWQALLDIATRHRQHYGGQPSRGKALAWLVEQESKRAGQPLPPLRLPGS